MFREKGIMKLLELKVVLDKLDDDFYKLDHDYTHICHSDLGLVDRLGVLRKEFDMWIDMMKESV